MSVAALAAQHGCMMDDHPEREPSAGGDSPVFWPLVVAAAGLVQGWLLLHLWQAWFAAQRSHEAGCPDECLGDLSVMWWGFWVGAWPFIAAGAAVVVRRVLRLFPH